MQKLLLSKISRADLKRYVGFEENGIQAYEWLDIEAIPLTQAESQQLDYVQSNLLNYDTHLMNGATIWA
jgi:hypothetical protein